MQCYLNLLGIGTGGASNSGAAGTSTFGAASTASTDLSASAKVLLLQSLRSFVVLASGEASPDGLAAEDAQNQHQTPGSYRKSAQQPACPTWFFEPSFNSPQDFEYFERFLQGPNANARVFAGPEDASNLSEDWHSAHFVPGALVDVDQTAGRTWSAADLHTVLGRAENALRLRAEDGAGEGSRSSSAATTGPYLVSPIKSSYRPDCRYSSFNCLHVGRSRSAPPFIRSCSPLSSIAPPTYFRPPPAPPQETYTPI